jgi:hypothetical protein
MPFRAFRILGLLALAFLLGACFEPPVDESVQFRFLPHGAVVVTSTVLVMDETREGSNPRRSI